ncbi:hypothetical protein BX661DRAFT_223993, partial [Kickxella alabastrina]|uniref:uncharacterized protein n=1 Tax=Kickxella alabastrina TaxID=61397 RepID=UPI0022205713
STAISVASFFLLFIAFFSIQLYILILIFLHSNGQGLAGYPPQSALGPDGERGFNGGYQPQQGQYGGPPGHHYSGPPGQQYSGPPVRSPSRTAGPLYASPSSSQQLQYQGAQPSHIVYVNQPKEEGCCDGCCGGCCKSLLACCAICAICDCLC